jgi:hypothetical protein
MDILTAYAGLSLAFVIIASLFLYFIIGSKAHVVIKAVLIPIVIWFTLVLYFTPAKLMGWPTPAEPPDGSIVLMQIVKEPVGDVDGFIDLVVVVRDESKRMLIEQLKPVNIFSYNAENTVRIYRLTYDRDLHKKLLEARKKARKINGYTTYNRSSTKSKEGKSGKTKPGAHKDDSPFKVVNPADKLPKNTE